MTHTIQIIRGLREWNARHSDPEIVRLFSTDTLPTPFLLTCPKDTVIKTIQQKNPGYLVF